MPANDERDPLDRWLDQQVRPLPPPPGTFELITRRARRRKVRRAVITVVSAAAVAAAVAIAVPGGLLLKVSPSQVPASSLANGATPTPGGGTESPNGTASRDRASTSPSPGSTGPLTEPSGPVPANFAPTSVTFVSPTIAWVIGQAGTPGKCDNKDPYVCTSIARTDNGGKSWEGEPAPDTTGPNGPAGVSAIRYLDGVNGWAFGPELWATHDAGNTWTQVPTGGYRVTDLETAGDRAFALWALCPDAPAGTAVASGCTSYTLMSTAAGSDGWSPVGGLTSGLTDQGTPTSAVLELTGSVGYLLAPDGTLYEGPISGGAWTKAGTAPCQPGPAQADGLPSGAFLALQNAENLAIACYGSAIPGGVQVSISSDGGQLWTAQSQDVWSGITSVGTPTSLAATSAGVLVLATTTGIYVQPGTGSSSSGPPSLSSTAQWTASSASGTAAPAGGFTYVGMTTPDQGVAVPADTALHEMYLTYDGGSTWTPSTPIEPGP
jgi:hypothetical protein